MTMVAPSSPANLVSSSSTLWATASKEWVIQPKPKPGRKPKKDVASPPKVDDLVCGNFHTALGQAPPLTLAAQLDNKGRRVQNRAAQRAFRERKQSQLAELQARVQSYEQGEIERNVALQNIAKRLKDENEALRLENSLLKERMLKAEREREAFLENDKKRWRDDSPSNNASMMQPPALKRSKVCPDSPRPNLTNSYTPSPPSMVSSPGSNGTSDTRFSPLPYETQTDPRHSPDSNLLSFSSNVKSHNLESGNGFPAFDCGFCNEDTPCVCREIAVQQAADRMGAVDFKPESFTQSNSLVQLNQTIRLEPSPVPVPPRTSILENLPAYQPPVPLRRRSSAPLAANTVFAVVPPPALQQASPANCSGDPSNCMACADDAFGKAFCLAVGESVATQAPCSDCPCLRDQTTQGDHNNTTSPATDCCANSASSNYHPNSSSVTLAMAGQSNPETIPTNDAWRQLKSHPNVEFTDLALLADVVARRSKCAGPKVVISPALGSITPERTASPGAQANASDHGQVLLTDPHAHYRERERARSNGPSSPRPRLVPQDILMMCARRRVREVQTDAVQAALRILDAKFS